ncbi:DUF5591 domain-containing protein [Sulfuracidifex tepidarius]|uniref:DUF5591 domain-containing protein n=1 Tax=Sulfuracidifex tepidarius TaxID=1294262 RepID=UPI000AC8E54B|nr:DUF5591 domain-containing protein [Sulfuracidifex tepidarius]
MINCQTLYYQLKINSFQPIIKREGEDLFINPTVKKWHEFFFQSYESTKPLALLLPCTSVKPYSRSATHRLVYSILKRKNLDNHVQVYSVSEPMLLVPREVEECYPFSSYEYSPKVMTVQEKDEFVELLRKPLAKIAKQHKVIVGVLPTHHYSIVDRASRKEGLKLYLMRYGKLAFRSISESIENLETKGKEINAINNT